jgi:hypothetical protein
MPLLDVQRRGYQVGRLRIGQQVATSRGGTRPARLDTWRFTTHSRAAADRVAELYGGEVREWSGQLEIITSHAEISVTVPPRDQVISQWYEMWNRGGAIRRCDSQHEQISGGACLCPHAADPSDRDAAQAAALERSRLAKLSPPQGCSLVTRLSVMIPDLPGLGVWRLDTGSYWAATEMGDQADVLQMARDRGVFLPAVLRIEHRATVRGGKTTEYPVPVLEIRATLRELAPAAVATQLGPPPAAALAIEAPPAAAEDVPAAAPAAPGDRPAAGEIAARAAAAVRRADIEDLAGLAAAAGVVDDMVCADQEEDVWESLRDVLQDRWRALPAVAKEAA